MKVLPLRINENGHTVSPIERPRPISCPPPSTVTQVQDASTSLLAEAYAVASGAVTREGTSRHQAAIALEHARLLHHVEHATEWAVTLHSWKITELGRFEYEHKLECERGY